MNPRDRMLDLLPPPLSVAPESVLAQLLEVAGIELEAFAQDLDRVRRTHWVNFVYRLEDLEKLAVLVGTERLSWEELATFRARLLALTRARLAGAVGPREIRGFVFEYLSRAEDALHATFVPGLGHFDAESAFEPHPEEPGFRPLALVENPPRLRRSGILGARRERVPYLFRWEETNHGIEDTFAVFTVIGTAGGKTAVPIIANLTTGDLLGYAGVLGVGQRLRVAGAGADDPVVALATLDDRQDVTDRLFTTSQFQLGVPFNPGDFDPVSRLPRLPRGTSVFAFLSAGLYDAKGLDHVFFAIADAELREGVFDQTRFDHSLFPSGTVAGLEMEWTELEPASFEVRVPRYLVIEPSGAGPFHPELADALAASVVELHAAGVRARLRFEPFGETQDQRTRVRLPWVVLPPESGPVGSVSELSLGARFGESALTATRFE